MRRFLALSASISMTAALAAGAASVVGGCSDDDATSGSYSAGDASMPRRDGSVVEMPEAGPSDAGMGFPAPSCEKYCDLIGETCTNASAQYNSRAECMAFCNALPVGKGGEEDTNTVACRQFYAGSPSRADAPRYCGAAGPFGGGVCGDRCTVFCQLTTTLCSADAGIKQTPYASQPECVTACSTFPFRDAGVDGGGESPTGPDAGNTLNCRLFYLRTALTDTSACAELGPDSRTCY